MRGEKERLDVLECEKEGSRSVLAKVEALIQFVPGIEAYHGMIVHAIIAHEHQTAWPYHLIINVLHIISTEKLRYI